jgi:hypothetical protein
MPLPLFAASRQRAATTASGIAGKAWRAVKAAGRQARILFRAARILATSRDLPVVLRVLFVVGCVQIPVLPFDELALAIALVWLFAFHRGTLRGALAKARENTSP